MKAPSPPWLALLAATLTIIDAIRSLLLIGFRYVDEDVAIYWFATQEFALMKFREPFFYGQAYNHLGEALLAAPLISLGIPVWIATAAVSMAVGLAPWFLLAFLAWRRRATCFSILLLACPAVMPAGYQILLARYYGMGILMVVLAFFLAGLSRKPALPFVGFLLALGVLLVPNAILPAAAGLPWLASERVRNNRDWLALGLGGMAAAGIYALGRSFYLVHPGWALHSAPSFDFKLSLLVDALRHVSRHLSRVMPSAFLHPMIPLLGLAALASWAAWKRNRMAFASSAAVFVLVIVAFGMSKVHEGTASVFFSYERMFLGLPLAIGLVGLSCLDSGLWPSAITGRATLVAICIACAFAIPKQVSLAKDVEVERRTPGSVCEQTEVAAVRDLSAQVQQAAAFAGTDLAVFLVYRSFAYACGALCYGTVTTLYPPYERRTWLLEDEALKSRGRVLLVDVEPDAACRHIIRQVPEATCAALGPTIVGVTYAPESALALVRRLGIRVRNF